MNIGEFDALLDRVLADSVNRDANRKALVAAFAKEQLQKIIACQRLAGIRTILDAANSGAVEALLNT